mmetsp:Transcript_55059/g.103191  ORF Transcript_55059/g.103191 Transcript_55059/m.103191 type:complete len:123 (+) Transcript_55059:145-513(+)
MPTRQSSVLGLVRYTALSTLTDVTFGKNGAPQARKGQSLAPGRATSHLAKQSSWKTWPHMATATLLSSSKSSRQHMQVVCERNTLAALAGVMLDTWLPVECITSCLLTEHNWKCGAETAKEP